MKLYTTITNEKGKTEAVGGNELLTININKGNRRMAELYITVEDLNDSELFVIDMLTLENGETKRVYDYPFYNKGEKQKGETSGRKIKVYPVQEWKGNDYIRKQ